MNDLLALATLRRLLLELGAPLGPEVEGTLVGPLEQWMHTPREDLGGDTPLHALSLANGIDQVRQCLRCMVNQTATHSIGPTLPGLATDPPSNHPELP